MRYVVRKTAGKLSVPVIVTCLLRGLEQSTYKIKMFRHTARGLSPKKCQLKLSKVITCVKAQPSGQWPLLLWLTSAFK